MNNWRQAGGDPTKMEQVQRTAQPGLGQEFFKFKTTEMRRSYHQERELEQTGDEMSSEELVQHAIHTTQCARGLQQSTVESSTES